MHKRGLTCWDQGPSLGLPGLWEQEEGPLFSAGGKGTEEEPHTGLEPKIQVVGGLPGATASSVQKSFPARHGESTRGDPEQPLRGGGQRGLGSRAEACEE